MKSLITNVRSVGRWNHGLLGMRLQAAARRTAVALGAVGLAALLSAPGQVLGDDRDDDDDDQPRVPGDSFVLLLKGIYKPVQHGRDLGLSQVDLSDGTYSKVKIYPVSGIAGDPEEAIGKFFVNWDVTLCAYKLPGGAFAAAVTEFLPTEVEIDGKFYVVGAAELVISEATGIYKSFVGGSIHMEFITQMIDELTWDEYCLCYISR